MATVLHGYDYRLKPTGHRHQVIEGAKTTTYAYDDLYRLTDETIAGAPDSALNGTIGYTLDKVGNRESRVSSTPVVSGVADYQYDARDRLTQIDGRALDYNRAGSTTGGRIADLGLDGVATGPLAALGAQTTYTDVYDFEERLVQRTYADGSQVILGYDADGLRVRKTILNSGAALVSSTTYLVCTNNLTGYAQALEERTTSGIGNEVRVYSYGTDLIGQDRRDPATSVWAYSYYGYDGHGSVRELFDEVGHVTNTYIYDAFGVLTARTGATPNHYRYAGEQFDEDLGLSYNRARYLNLNTGRFWSMDEYEGSLGDPASLHKYNYGSNNPVMFMDPSGHYSLAQISVASGVIGVLAGITVPQIRGVGNGMEDADFGTRFVSCISRSGGDIALMVLATAAGIEWGGAPVPKLPGEFALGTSPAAGGVTTRLSRLNVPIAKWVIKNIGPRASFEALRTIGFVFRHVRGITTPIGAFAVGYTVGVVPSCAYAAQRDRNE